MYTVRIEHSIADYAAWKRAFDSDPINRRASGVTRYRIYRPADQADWVAIELDLPASEQARAVMAALQKIFPAIEGKIIFAVQVKLLDMVEETAL